MQRPEPAHAVRAALALLTIQGNPPARLQVSPTQQKPFGLPAEGLRWHIMVRASRPATNGTRSSGPEVRFRIVHVAAPGQKASEQSCSEPLEVALAP